VPGLQCLLRYCRARAATATLLRWWRCSDREWQMDGHVVTGHLIGLAWQLVALSNMDASLLPGALQNQGCRTRLRCSAFMQPKRPNTMPLAYPAPVAMASAVRYMPWHADALPSPMQLAKFRNGMLWRCCEVTSSPWCQHGCAGSPPV
jgi:uncharacterized iron-regulated membrane protein